MAILNDKTDRNIIVNQSQQIDCSKPSRIQLSPTKSRIQDKCDSILDEMTGDFLLRPSSNTDFARHLKNSSLMYDDVRLSIFSNKIMYLDETTGKFIESESLCDSNSEENLDSSSSKNQSDEENSTPNVTDIRLDETSGIMSRKRARKNTGNVNDWERNKKKKARENGQSYYSRIKERKTSSTGFKLHKNRSLKGRCNSKRCELSKKFKCNEISEDQRIEIFSSFWSKQNWDKKKSYVISLVENRRIQSHLRVKDKIFRKNSTLRYYLIVNNQRVLVCKKMFLNTLDLGEWSVLHWVKDSNKYGILKKKVFLKPKAPLSCLKSEHINDFLDLLPKMPSHYCRAQSDKIYLDITYTSAMDVYRHFEKHLIEKNISNNQKGGYELFLRQMHSKNIGIFTPRKDQCDLCVSYSNGTCSKEDYNGHVFEKDRAREEKKRDKENAVASMLNVYTVDVQAVQLIPFLPAASLYFKQKLACHQFTTYNLSDGNVLCYVWHEAEGAMDANIFSSCILDFLDNEVSNILSTPVIFYSDGCPAQNRNSTLSNALFYFATKNDVNITQKYLVKGHSQMECDSVHAKIEARKKNREIHGPKDYIKIIEESRIKKPYRVKYIDHTFFKDFSKLQFFKSIRPGRKAGDHCVHELRALNYIKNKIMYKISFEDDWKILPQKLNPKVSIPSYLDSLYTGPISIPLKKYQDLQSLKKVINRKDHYFYDNLPHLDK